MLHFNFSAVNPQPDQVQQAFDVYAEQKYNDFLKRYEAFLDVGLARELEKSQTAGGKLNVILNHCTSQKLKLYILIDEYDNFANTIISMEREGDEAYHSITHGTGFFRHFFSVLKEGTGSPDSGLARLFVAGVSPITMDDVTSGYNIGLQVSQDPPLAQLCGFTREEVSQLIQSQNIPQILNLNLQDILSLMEAWYGGYRFARQEGPALFNPDMVLYFTRNVLQYRELPQDMVDHNVRIDYNKLHHLILIDRKLNGNFSRLKQIVEEGSLVSIIATGFPLEALVREQNFISLLYYFGLLTFRGVKEGASLLAVPNLVVAQLVYGYIRDAYEEADVFKTRMSRMIDHVRMMAYRGQWLDFFQNLAEQIKEQTSIRDFLGGEKVIQGFLLAYLSIADHFIIHSEQELNKGFCDLYLEPFSIKYPDMKYGYLIELKYFNRSKASEARLSEKIEAALQEGRQQLAGYILDPRLQKVSGKVTWICPVLVFHGWELVGSCLYEDTTRPDL